MTAQLGGDWNIIHIAITFLATGTGFSTLAYAINTLPVPTNPYGRWLLGVAQYVIGQRARSTNTFNNQDTITTPVTKKLP